jgi:glycosyltransferase involved in cell wall biosynthesis
MRITILGVNYRPELTGIAPYTADLAEGLTRRGHYVNVVTGFPHYPEWFPDPRYGGSEITEMINGVTVTRLRHFVPPHMTVPQRSRLELSFGWKAMVSPAVSASRDSDVVICVSPALLASALAMGRLRAFRGGPPLGVWVQDLYSRGVVETGVMDGRSARMVSRLESQILRAADGVVVIHDRFAAHLRDSLNVPRERVTVIPNWSHMSSNRALFTREQARELLGWRQDAVVALHAGNMGLKQGLENVVAAARLADAHDSPVEFVLLGDGNQRTHLEGLGKDVRALRFLRPLPDEHFSAALYAADALLVNESPGISEMAVPSKLTSYFGSGRPVVAATHSNSVTHGELKRSGAGLQVPPGSPEHLLSAVVRLGADRELSDHLGNAGLAHLGRELGREAALDRFECWLGKMVGGQRRNDRNASSDGFLEKSDLTMPYR